MSNLPVQSQQPFSMQPVAMTPASQYSVALSEAETRAKYAVFALYEAAMRWPRDEQEARRKIMNECTRQSLAQSAQYIFPRGDAQVSGPSIHLMQTIARNWGNCDFGWEEIGYDEANNSVMIRAWAEDRQTRVFRSLKKSIKMQKMLKGGNVKMLLDERDRMEHVASYAMRYVRSCIQSIIPIDLIEEAMFKCDDTLKGKEGTAIAIRIEKMADAFMSIAVTTKMIETRLRHKMETCNETELLELGRIYNTLRDDMGKTEDYFPPEGSEHTAARAPVALKKKAEAPKPAAPVAKPSPATYAPPDPLVSDDPLI